MPRVALAVPLAALVALATAGVAAADPGTDRADLARAIANAERMPEDPAVQRLAAAQGLDVVNVAWEDVGRFKGSSVGDNISDLTIQVEQCDARGESCSLHLMPAIRHPDFSDETADVPLDRLRVLVGNERGDGLRPVPLRDVLADLPAYLHEPGSWAGDPESLLAPRDTHALVSAQAAFLPVPRGGEATFNPVLFNYQSVPGDPAVLTLLATPEGTSATVIDNSRDQFAAGPTWGQRLFFNRDGQRTSLTGRRASDVAAGTAVDAGTRPSGPRAVDPGMSMVLLVQVPLKQRFPVRAEDDAAYESAAAAPAAPGATGAADVEAAVIGHGADEGPFTELAGLDIERDPRYPIRVTVQFYKATETGVVAPSDLAQIREQIDRVYADGDYVGSLVVEGETGRPTEHDGPKVETPAWWSDFQERLATYLPWLERTDAPWWRAG